MTRTITDVRRTTLNRRRPKNTGSLYDYHDGQLSISSDGISTMCVGNCTVEKCTFHVSNPRCNQYCTRVVGVLKK